MVMGEIEKTSVSITPAASHGTMDGEIVEQNDLKREFKPRHTSMFAIACAIGTGLIIGSGTGLTRGGPASLVISYVLIGACVYFIMTALGEMAAFLPMKKGFGGYATRMVDPALGYATGWNYFFKYVIATPTNLTASGIIIQYWRPDINVAVWITVFAFVIISINVLHVRFLGESEFCLSIVKIIVIVSLIFICFIISMGGSPSGQRIGFYYWQNPGAFAEYLAKGSVGKFLGWWACMVQACFAYTGTEVVGIAFGETPNPRKNIPRAIKQTFWRIFCFYILGVTALTMAVPYTNDRLVGATKARTSAAASPFVIAIQIAGINVLPDILNAGLLVFVLSAATTDIYCASRTIYGLAKDHQAPQIFAKTTKNGVPIYAVAISSAFCALGYLNVTNSSSTAFGYLSSLVTVFALLNWLSILLSYFSFSRALKAQDIARSQLPYAAAMTPFGAFYSIFITCLVIVFQGYDAFIPGFTASTFVLKYIGIVVYVFNIFFWKFLKKTRRVKAHEMDLETDRSLFTSEFEALQGDLIKTGSFWKKWTNSVTGSA